MVTIHLKIIQNRRKDTRKELMDLPLFVTKEQTHQVKSYITMGVALSPNPEILVLIQ